MTLLNEIVVIAIFLCLMLLLAWAFRALPAERWQFLATVPRKKMLDGHWDALNFTWYGALTAFAFTFSCVLVVVMTAALGIQSEVVFVSLLLLIGLSLWSARAVAQWVERLPGTHTIGGAVFVLVLLAPIVIPTVSAALSVVYGIPFQGVQQLLPMLAALAVAYAYGEGIGRIACISFGCCWGKRVDQLAGWQRKLFGRFHFVFDGRTKKIAYASQMEGVPVIPIQAITAAVYFLIGSIGLWLYLHALPRAALVLAMAGTQLWRFASEFMRADFRGVGRITIYQWMALACVALSCAYAVLLPDQGSATLKYPDLQQGFKALWTIGWLISFQIIGIAIFAITGRSSVTRSSLSLRVLE
jgi:Prolipoprotein diacylglyceryl transferase